MSHFYLTLPSNSSKKYYPSNTLTHFTTKLHDDFNLSGDWEVGLSEIRFPRTWHNLPDNEAIYVFCNDCRDIEPSSSDDKEVRGYVKDVNIGSGYYSSPQELVDAINRSIDREFSQPIKEWSVNDTRRKIARNGWPLFRFNPINKRVYAELPENVELKFTEKLGLMLGFKKRQHHLRNRLDRRFMFRSLRPSDIDLSLHAMFLYCDLLECVPVGDTLAPLLRIVDIQGEHGTTVNRYYEKPRYVPLQKKHFDSVEIDIRDDLGEPIPFETGKLIVTLHFKRAKRDYFVA
jgi:hypothetical protein